MKLLLFFVASILIAKGETEIECYSCDDCSKIEESTIKEICGNKVTSKPTEDPTEKSTITEEPENNLSQSVVTTTNSNQSKPSAISEPTNTSPVPPTAIKPDLSNNISTSELSPILPPAEPSISTLDPQTDSSLYPTTNMPPVETIISANSTNSSSVSLPPDTSASNSSNNMFPDISPLVSPATLVEEPSVDFNTESLQPASPSTSGEQEDSATLQDAIPAVFRLRNRREVLSEPESKFRCFKVDYTDGDKSKIKRGCVERYAEDKVCNQLEVNGKPPNRCHICDGNRCNTSSTLGLSTVGLLLLLGVSKIL